MRNSAYVRAGTWPVVLLLMMSASIENGVMADDKAPTTQPSAAKAAQSGVDLGLIAYKLTDPGELKHLLGDPIRESESKEGDGRVLMQEYAGVQAMFGKPMEETTPFVLRRLTVNGQEVDIGENRLVVLRGPQDLQKLDHFWGLANVSLAKLDLGPHLGLLNDLPFDSRTIWPAADKMPKGFDPARILETGKYAGLGIRHLHEQGIDGQGIHMAIIDQPLLRDHLEYKDRVVSYQGIEVDGVEPQMHGSPVTSIAVGKHCGVAPKASVDYYAVPTWKWWELHCRPYADVLDKITEQHKTLKPAERIRVVSISLGAFSQWPDYALWQKAVQRANEAGILVVSCDPAFLKIGTLKREIEKDPDDPANYKAGRYSPGLGALLVPAGNRSTASHVGPEMYTFWREGGMSWAVPYMAGLAALAVQVNPDIEPQAIVNLWERTAVKTKAGRIINPPAFIDEVRKLRAQTAPAS